MVSGKKCQQNFAANTVQPLPEDQRQTWRCQLHSRARNQAKDLQRAGHLPRRRRDPPAGRRQQEAIHRGRSWQVLKPFVHAFRMGHRQHILIYFCFLYLIAKIIDFICSDK